MKIQSFVTAVALSFPLFFSSGCSEGETPCEDCPDTTTTAPAPEVFYCKIDAPKNQSRVIIGDTITIAVSSSYGEEERTLDRVDYYLDKELLGSSDSSHTFDWASAGTLGGTHVIRAEAHYSDGKKGNQRVIVTVVSDEQPALQRYRIVQSYPHDVSSYTQGLVFMDGILYEGTGLNERSKLRKVDISTGKPIQNIDLADQYFGEGIAIFDNKIYQLTYTQQTCFVYDKETLGKLREFQFTSEGWGLTHNDTNLIMSDGSAVLKFLEPESFKEVRRIKAFDTNGEVTRLNELEYINGEIWANIYQTDQIARIDPTTGKVIAYINCAGLLSNQERQGTDVLNGIAYDAVGKRLFVTGKLWPKLFQIEIQNL